MQGVSIVARRKSPEHVLPFLLALGEVMQGTSSCAETALAELSQLAADVQAQWHERREAAGCAENAAAVAVAGAGGDGPQHQRVRDYFLQRQEDQRQQEAAGGDRSEGIEGGVGRIEPSGEQRAVLLLRKRQVHAAASLAQTAVDCCGPLALSSSLQASSHLFALRLPGRRARCVARPEHWPGGGACRPGTAVSRSPLRPTPLAGSQVAVQALQVCSTGLRCLRATTLALELCERQVEPLVTRRGEVAPPDPLTPKLLPSVHLLWSPLTGALKVRWAAWQARMHWGQQRRGRRCTCASGCLQALLSQAACGSPSQAATVFKHSGFAGYAGLARGAAGGRIAHAG